MQPSAKHPETTHQHFSNAAAPEPALVVPVHKEDAGRAAKIFLKVGQDP